MAIGSILSNCSARWSPRCPPLPTRSSPSWSAHRLTNRSWPTCGSSSTTTSPGVRTVCQGPDDVDLCRAHQPFGPGGDRVRVGKLVDRGRQRRLVDRGTLGERHSQVMHARQGEARVVTLPPPHSCAAQPGERAGAQRDDQRDGGDRRPAGAQVAPRPPQPQAPPRGPHRLTTAARRSAPVRRAGTVVHDPPAAELDHPVGGARDLLIVGHDQHCRARVRLAPEELEDLHACAEVQLVVGSSADRIGFAVARARARATRRCSPPESWCGKSSRRASSPRRRAPRPPPGQGRRVPRLRRRTARSRLRSGREEVEALEHEAHRVATQHRAGRPRPARPPPPR